MNSNHWIRRIHRWGSIAVAVAVTAVALARKTPASWATCLPLPPLFLLLSTGLYLFALPCVVTWRGRGRRPT